MSKSRTTIVGLALICACTVCALTASGASAAGTTAFTCVEGAGGKDFKDAHCNQQVEAGTGKFGHVSIKANETTEITASNEKTASETTASTPSRLVGTIAGTALEFVCSTVTGSGVLTNEEVEGAMQVSGEMNIEHSACAMSPPICTVAPMLYKTKFSTTGMGLEFKPTVGKKFGTLNLSGPECTIAGSYGIEGSFQGSPKGATVTLSAEGKTLKWGSSPYTLEASITLRKKGGEPIAFTT